MKFKCSICDFETENENEKIFYCDDCGEPMCEDHCFVVEHQGFDETICSRCAKGNKNAISFKEC